MGNVELRKRVAQLAGWKVELMSAEVSAHELPVHVINPYGQIVKVYKVGVLETFVSEDYWYAAAVFILPAYEQDVNAALTLTVKGYWLELGETEGRWVANYKKPRRPERPHKLEDVIETIKTHENPAEAICMAYVALCAYIEVLNHAGS